MARPPTPTNIYNIINNNIIITIIIIIIFYYYLFILLLLFIYLFKNVPDIFNCIV